MLALSRVFISDKSTKQVDDKKAFEGHVKTSETIESVSKGHVDLEVNVKSSDESVVLRKKTGNPKKYAQF